LRWVSLFALAGPIPNTAWLLAGLEALLMIA